MKDAIYYRRFKTSDVSDLVVNFIIDFFNCLDNGYEIYFNQRRLAKYNIGFVYSQLDEDSTDVDTVLEKVILKRKKQDKLLRLSHIELILENIIEIYPTTNKKINTVSMNYSRYIDSYNDESDKYYIQVRKSFEIFFSELALKPKKKIIRGILRYNKNPVKKNLVKTWNFLNSKIKVNCTLIERSSTNISHYEDKKGIFFIK